MTATVPQCQADCETLGPCTQTELDAWAKHLDRKDAQLLLMWVDRALKAEAVLAALPPEATGGMVKPTLMDPISSEQRVSSEENPARCFYQSHECEGYRAKVTIEWSMPVDGDLLPAWRKDVAEDIADAILSFSARRVRQMVQAMRGFKIEGGPARSEKPQVNVRNLVKGMGYDTSSKKPLQDLENLLDTIEAMRGDKDVLRVSGRIGDAQDVGVIGIEMFADIVRGFQNLSAEPVASDDAPKLVFPESPSNSGSAGE